jgi:ketosteroid isomerase-like protein
MTDNRELLDHYVERYNAGDLDACMELYAEDAVQAMPDGIFEGREAIHERLVRDLDAFPDVTYTVESFVEQGDAFADEFTIVGTHTATGKRVEIRGMELVRMRDGKIVVDNLYYDPMSIVSQAGLVPEGATA